MQLTPTAHPSSAGLRPAAFAQRVRCFGLPLRKGCRALPYLRHALLPRYWRGGGLGVKLCRRYYNR